MATCEACVSRRNNNRCCNKPLIGLIYCGIHARAKLKRNWLEVNDVNKKVILIQKVWRGYSLRNWIKLAGPGVMSRDICHNDEELVTLDDKKTVSPLDYFSFEESGKVYWFDIRTILQNSIDKIRPENPYTREPLSIETRQRLRKLAIMRDRRKIKNIHTENNQRTADKIIEVTWTSVSQIIEENGFPEMNPMHFMALNRPQLFIFITMIHQDIVAWAAEHTTEQSRRRSYLPWTRGLAKQYMEGLPFMHLSYVTARTILTMLNDYPDPYTLCFIIMSALHRL